MKITFYISVAASALSLVLSVVLFTFGGINQGLQTEIQKQQQEIQKQQEPINKGNELNQTGSNILRDMSIFSIKNEKIKALLTRHGFPLPTEPAASDSSTPAPAPASTPAPAPASTPALR